MYEMGKMTKHKCDWKPTQLEAAITAKELYAHTATILGNPNQFKPRYDLDRMTLREGTVFLGFLHRVADSGKVLVSCDPAKVKANRRKMRRLANKIIRRQVHRTALAESWRSIYNHLAKGNSKRLERRMTEFYNNLEKEIEGVTP